MCLSRAADKPVQRKCLEIGKAPIVKEGEPTKSKYRKSGTGCINKLNDHLWKGRCSPKVNGKKMVRNIYAHSEEECEEKLAQMIREMKIEIEKLKQGG